jgi:hypothetical protein
MAMSSFDRVTGGPVNPTTQPYNNFRVQTLGGNIVQGQINKIRVAEILFPYCIPTVVGQTAAVSSGGAGSGGQNNGQGNSELFFKVWSVTPNAGNTVDVSSFPVSQISIPTGFYTGTEMEAAIVDGIDNYMIANGIPAGTFTFEYDATSNSFVFQNENQFDDNVGSNNYFGQFQFGGSSFAGSTNTLLSQPNILWTIGLRDIYARYPPLPAAAFGNRLTGSSNTWMLVPWEYANTATYGGVSGWPTFPANYGPEAINTSNYTGLYTQYIDICSPTLCQAQYVRDGNTNQFVIHRDLICRLYIANEVSLFQTDPTGTRPFVIHRQFKNAKVMKWTAERSIDAIDIQLFDQFGNPLPVVPPFIGNTFNPHQLEGPQILQGQPSDFSITFLVDEHDETREHNVGYTA